VVESRFCRGDIDGQMTESHNHEASKIPLAPLIDEKEDKEFALFSENDFRKFAEDYIDKRKGLRQPRE
jgi:hypothetical protein